jgi:hypothetical protein
VYAVLAWFADRAVPEETRRAARDRFEAAASVVVPETYARQEFGGDDWGVTIRHRAEQGAYRWPVVASADGVTAVSLGLPVGLDVADGPVGLARRLLAGTDVHRDVVPPFGLIALDGSGRFAAQQDWLGMCRLFVGEADGVTALCSRPSLLVTFLRGAIEPDLAGWSSYAICGHFGGEFSPVSGARLLKPGERMTGRRRHGGGWTVASQSRYGVDDVVLAGVEARGRPLQAPLDLAAYGLTSTAASVYRLYDDEITLGLSGGKDSRLIAAALLSAGRLPRFTTNDDVAVEGEVARELVQRLRDKRGLEPEHRVAKSGAPAKVLALGLRERVLRMQRLYDYQFPSTYTVRPASPAMMPVAARQMTLTGAGGELAVGYWYPTDTTAPTSPVDAALAHLLSAVPGAAAAPEAMSQERDRVAGLLAHAAGLGIDDLHLADYLYLVERVRRWYTSAYVVGMVTPFLSPAFVSASFALTPEQKRDRVLHSMLLDLLVPEWSGIPFVSPSSGPSTATRVWEGDGVRVVCDLLDTARGRISRLIRHDAVECALRRCVHGPGVPNEKALQQFACLAVAAHHLEPDAVAPVTSATYARVTAPAPPRTPPPRSRLGWAKRTRPGRRLVRAIRRYRRRSAR